MKMIARALVLKEVRERRLC